MAQPGPLPFSPAGRAAHWATLGAGVWDLLVVGGGVTGAGIARDAVGRGLRVALIDAGDWGGGTSSRSSRLVHGGLRYLETYQFHLVHESSVERRQLMRLAPHLVHPLPFLFPTYRGGPVRPALLRAGMWLYDALSLFRNTPHRMLERDAALDLEPGLRTPALTGAALYYDAAVDDARLALATARAAAAAGAAALSYVEMVALSRTGALTRVRARDTLTGAETELTARLVVNATGPWCDAVRRLADASAAPRLRPTKGVHVMLPAERVGNAHAITFRSVVDDRVMFVLPAGDLSYIGTTDTDFSGDPADATATTEDVAYLLDSANALLPEARLSDVDVVSTWAGVRPLLAPRKSRGGASETPREHEIWRDPSGLLNVAGGKLTTYRLMAHEAADRAAKILRRERGRRASRSRTWQQPLPGAPAEPWPTFARRVAACAAALDLPTTTAAHLARAHGTAALDLLAAARADRSLATPLSAGRPYIEAEVEHAVACEMALTIEDVLRRRTQIFYETRDGGVGAAERVAERMASRLGWDAAETARQLAGYAEAVRRTRPG